MKGSHSADLVTISSREVLEGIQTTQVIDQGWFTQQSLRQIHDAEGHVQKDFEILKSGSDQEFKKANLKNSKRNLPEKQYKSKIGNAFNSRPSFMTRT